MIARFFALLFFFCSFASYASAEQRFVYVSEGGNITVFNMDGGTGKLTKIQSVKGGGPQALSPDKTRLYAIGGGLSSYEIGKNGKLKLLKNVEGPRGGSYLATDATGKFLASSNYGKATASVWAIGENGVSDGEPIHEMVLEKQVHSSVFSPDNRFLLVPATGPNRVFQLVFDEKTGEISANDPPFALATDDPEAAQQPRHIVFHPSGKLAYTTQERELPGVAMWKWDAAKGSLTLQQTIVSVPDDFEGVITTADLHLTPDAKFLYVSNRDLTDRKAKSGNSSIAAFSIGEDGGMTLLGHTACEHVPRSFAIDEAGEFMVVAGQSADKVGVYRIDGASGDLERIQQLETGSSPSWVTCLTLP